MGQQQLLLVILGTIIVAVAIGVGVSQFGAQSAQSNKDGVTISLMNIAANAYQYKIRPSTLGGGSGSYSGYTIPSKMRQDDFGRYTAPVAGATSCIITGTSSLDPLFVATCTVDDTGRTQMTYNGW